MIYSLKYNNLLSSTDGSIENIRDPFEKYDIIDYYYILPEAGDVKKFVVIVVRTNETI